MDELRKSVNWSAPNVNEQVNQLLQKLALSRLQEYQKEGDHIFGPVYNDKGQQVNVADQFEYMLSYYQVLPKDLPDFNKYILDYPNAKMPNVQNIFRWERVNFGLKPTLFIIQVLTMRGDKSGEAAYVIADKQLYSSHYFETSLDLTFLILGDDPKYPGFLSGEDHGLRTSAVDRRFEGLDGTKNSSEPLRLKSAEVLSARQKCSRASKVGGPQAFLTGIFI